VIADEAEDPFELTAAEEAELAEAIAEVERGEVEHAPSPSARVAKQIK
jgi:hypothetical protein